MFSPSSQSRTLEGEPYDGKLSSTVLRAAQLTLLTISYMFRNTNHKWSPFSYELHNSVLNICKIMVEWFNNIIYIYIKIARQ